MSDDTLPGLPPDPPLESDSILGLFLAILATMPAAQRNAILSLLDFLNSLPREELALIAKAAQPHLTDAEIATLCGVSIRQVHRWKRYRSFKPKAADYWRDHQQTFYTSDDAVAEEHAGKPEALPVA
jgi:hypothetical protein